MLICKHMPDGVSRKLEWSKKKVIKYMVIQKGWDFRDDCTEFV